MLTAAQFDDIFAKIEAGGTLLKILPTLTPALPRSTFLDWIAKDADLADRYARAMQFRADSWAESVVETGADAKLAPDHRRVAIEALKWGAAKAAPKKYGDRLELAGDVTIRNKAAIDKSIEAALAADD